MLRAYKPDGDVLNFAYDYDGNLIYQSQYATYTITNLYGQAASSQGFDVYENILAQWNGSGHTLGLRNVNSGGYIVREIPTDITSHGNDISFFPYKYDSGDTLPLLLVDNICLRFYQVNGSWVSSVIKTYKFQYNTYGSGFNGNTLITISYTSNTYTYSESNKLVIQTWDMTNLTENQDGTFTPEMLTSVTRPWLECVQGASYHDGYFWIASGLGNAIPSHVYALNIRTGNVELDVNLQANGELEGQAWAYNEIDGWYALTAQLGGYGYRKITFAPAST